MSRVIISFPDPSVEVGHTLITRSGEISRNRYADQQLDNWGGAPWTVDLEVQAGQDHQGQVRCVVPFATVTGFWSPATAKVTAPVNARTQVAGAIPDTSFDHQAFTAPCP